MANNRMQVYCTKCLAMTCFAKYYPSTGWYVASGSNPARLEEFFDRHNKSCGPDSDDEYQWGTERFKFRSEMDDDGLLSNYDSNTGLHTVVKAPEKV